MNSNENLATDLKNILGTKSKVTLITGAAAAGKTKLTLDLYNYFSSKAVGSAAIITPNSQTRSRILNLLKNGSQNKVLLSPKVFTLTSFFSKLFSATDIQAKQISNFDKYLHIEKIIKNLNQSGRIAACNKIVDKPGLISSLVKSIAEIKRLGISPEQLIETFSDNISKYSDLVLVYSEYQRYLRENNLYDSEGQDWLVKLFLDNTPKLSDSFLKQAGLCGVVSILFDGFTDFSSTQLDIIKLLSTSISQTFITLPTSQDDRKTLWSWSNKTRLKIKNKFKNFLSEVSLNPRKKNTIINKIFSDSQSKSDLSNVTIVSASGQAGEVRSAALQIKKILLNPETSSDTVGIIARNLDDYFPIIENLFRQAKIPVRKNVIKLSQVPVIKFIVKIIKLHTMKFDHNAFIDIINSSYFSPSISDDKNNKTIFDAIAFIRKNNLTNLYDKKNINKHKSDEIDFINTTLDLIAELKTADDLMQSKLFKSLYQTVLNNDDPEQVSLDIKALNQLNSLLENYIDEPALNVVKNLNTISITRSAAIGAVDVNSVIDSKNIRWDHTIILGVSEGQFPAKLNQGIFLLI